MLSLGGLGRRQLNKRYSTLAISQIFVLFFILRNVYICATEYIREQRHLAAFGIRVFAETIFCVVACTSLELFDDHFPLTGPWQNAYSRAATLSLLFPKCPETTLLLLFPVPFGNNAQVLLWCLNSAYTPPLATDLYTSTLFTSISVYTFTIEVTSIA